MSQLKKENILEKAAQQLFCFADALRIDNANKIKLINWM